MDCPRRASLVDHAIVAPVEVRPSPGSRQNRDAQSTVEDLSPRHWVRRRPRHRFSGVMVIAVRDGEPAVSLHRALFVVGRSPSGAGPAGLS